MYLSRTVKNNSLIIVHDGLINNVDLVSTSQQLCYLWQVNICLRINELRHEKTCFFCICKNKYADQLRCNCAADQRLRFRYKDRTIPLLSKSEILSLLPSSMVVQPDLCGT